MVMSALHLKADMCGARADVRYGPADIDTFIRNELEHHYQRAGRPTFYFGR
jgi:hypothetical protein